MNLNVCLQLISIPRQNTSKVYDNKKKKKSVNFLFQILKNQINIKIDFYFLKIKLKIEKNMINLIFFYL